MIFFIFGERKYYLKVMVCQICGGSEFYIHNGIEHCKECSIQLASTEEKSSEECFTKGGLLRSPKVQKEDKTKEKKIVFIPWTMNEAYNLILSKQVSALIKLGCSKQLKTVVLHMWAKYLQLCEYCFQSNNDDNTPHLSVFAKRRDIQMLYGGGNYGRKQKVNSKRHSKLKEKKDSRKLKKEDEVTEGNSANSLSDFTVKREQDSESSAENSISVSSEDRNSNFSDEEIVVPQKREPVYSSHAAKMEPPRKPNKKVDIEEACVHHMTLSKTLSFCYLGLLYTQDQLQLLDLIRLANEGKIPYVQVTQHFPPTMQLQEKDYCIFTRFSTRERKEISLTSAKLFEFLGLPKFKHPPRMQIVARFVKDLNLPNDIIPIVKTLIDKCGQQKEVFYTTVKHGSLLNPIPSYESEAMAFIVITLKMLFVLDGEFEKEHSEIMAKINAVIEDKTMFVWSEWKKQTTLKEYLFIKDGNTFSNLNRIDSLNVDRIIGSCPALHSNPEFNIVLAKDAASGNKSSADEIKAVLESFVNIYDLKEPPTSFPLTCQLHRLMIQWEKLPMYRNTTDIDFSFISKDFSSHKLYYWPSSTSDSKELINILLSSLYKSSEFVHLGQNFESYFEKIVRTTKSYWHGTHTHKTMDKKEKWLEDLPSSFRWLLKFLSKYLQINCIDFYIEIRDIEKKLFKANS